MSLKPFLPWQGNLDLVTFFDLDFIAPFSNPVVFKKLRSLFIKFLVEDKNEDCLTEAEWGRESSLGGRGTEAAPHSVDNYHR